MKALLVFRTLEKGDSLWARARIQLWDRRGVKLKGRPKCAYLTNHAKCSHQKVCFFSFLLEKVFLPDLSSKSFSRLASRVISVITVQGNVSTEESRYGFLEYKVYTAILY